MAENRIVKLTSGASNQGQLWLYELSGGGASYNILTAPAALSANATITLPNATSTLSGLGLAETASGAKTFSGGVTISSSSLTSAGGTLAGSWAGTPTFTQEVTLSGGATLSGTFSGAWDISGAVSYISLTANDVLELDGAKVVTGNTPTGTGAIMKAASPATTGTLTGAIANWSGLNTFNAGATVPSGQTFTCATGSTFTGQPTFSSLGLNTVMSTNGSGVLTALSKQGSGAKVQMSDGNTGTGNVLATNTSPTLATPTLTNPTITTGTMATPAITTPSFVGTPTGTITSSSFTPTEDTGDRTNVSATSTGSFHYIRVGEVVSVSGTISITASGSGQTRASFTLPVTDGSETTPYGALSPLGNHNYESGGVYQLDSATSQTHWTCGAFVGGSGQLHYAVSFMYRIV